MELKVKFVCNQGEISDVVDATAPKGKSDTFFVQEKGTVQHAVIEYGGQLYEVPRGKSKKIGANGQPQIHVEVIDKPNKALLRYVHVEAVELEAEKELAYRLGWDHQLKDQLATTPHRKSAAPSNNNGYNN
jgi:tRNA G18 (ribose-2'-O)-methylase SpoU